MDTTFLVLYLIVFFILSVVFSRNKEQTEKTEVKQERSADADENIVDWNGVKVKLGVPKLDTRTLNRAFKIVDTIQPRVLTGNQGGLTQLYYDKIRSDILNQILDFYVHKGRFPAGDFCCITTFLNESKRTNWYHIPDFVTDADSTNYFPYALPIDLKDENVRKKILPFETQISNILTEWRKSRPDRKYPGGGRLPPKGYPALKRYLEAYVYRNGQLPEGVHYIPAGPDVFQTTADGFEVKFPSLINS